jgi:hypothetical protein
MWLEDDPEGVEHSKVDLINELTEELLKARAELACCKKTLEFFKVGQLFCNWFRL